MLLTLTSTNPQMSWVIGKNPATQISSEKPFVREVRRGVSYGYFLDPKVATSYAVLFRDNPNELSFGPPHATYEYLDRTRYGHPYAAVSLIDAQLRSALIGGFAEFDTPAEASVSAVFNSGLGFLRTLAKVFSSTEGRSVEVIPVPGIFESDQVNQVVCKASTIKEALSLMVLVGVLCTLKGDDLYLPMEVKDLIRIEGLLEAVQAPYFPRHLVLVCADISPEKLCLFEKEAGHRFGSSIGASLQAGNSQVQRGAFIRSKLRRRKGTLFDLGCGDGDHSLRLAGDFDKIIAVDKDQRCIDNAFHRARKKGLSNIFVNTAEVSAEWIRTTPELAGASVLLSEVVEHMPKRAATEILFELLRAGVKEILLTAPNGDFNQHFFLEGMRHPDHDWEPAGMKEWGEFIQSAVSEAAVVSLPYFVDLAPGGDSVGQESLFLTAHIQLRNP